MPVIYEERSTGRYFAKYGALQGYRKSVRYAALQGRYEYDIEAAHQNILIEIFNRKTVTFEELNIVKNYIVSKDDIRNRLAKELDIPKSLVKTIITGLTYGSKLINNSKYSIYKDCKGDQVIIERILSNDWLKSLEAVFKKTVKHLIGSRTIIKNAVGIIRPLKEIDSSKGMNKSQAVAHILQGHEREILDVIIANYNRDTISLLLHDCVVFNGQLDSQEISRIVKENTNFTLSFKEGSY
jgi:ribosomal protein S24E